MIFFQIPFGNWWHWVSIRRYWWVLDCTWSLEGGTDCYLVVLGQYKVVLVGTWWYWIKTGRYWLPVWYAFRKYLVYMVRTIKSLNTGSVEGGTGWYSEVLGHFKSIFFFPYFESMNRGLRRWFWQLVTYMQIICHPILALEIKISIYANSSSQYFQGQFPLSKMADGKQVERYLKESSSPSITIFPWTPWMII